jgi:alanine-synthesizing transaminase
LKSKTSPPVANRHKFHRFDHLPPYVFAQVTDLMLAARRAGDDVIDLGMGNPDLPTPVAEHSATYPDSHRHLGSPEFSKRLLQGANVAVSPGIGFGSAGEGYVRFSLVENEHRIRQAVRNIRRLLERKASL